MEDKAFSNEKQTVVYPVKYEVKLDGETYTIDATDFGDCITYDHSGNYHWAGSAKIFDDSGDFIGTGFIEANQFQDFDNYTDTIIEGSGLSEKDVKLVERKMTFLQSLPSMLVLLIYITLWIMFIFYIFKK